MEAYGRVYLIWNMVNSKRYVGKTTKTVEERFKRHAHANNTAISQAIHKYGKENFRYGVIKTCATKEELDACEIFYIAALHSKAPYGYNLTDGGDGGNGFTPETREKLSAALTGKTFTAERCANISAAKKGKKQKPRSPQHCANISAVNRGKIVTAETGAKISVSKRGYSLFKNLLRELDARKMSYAALAKLLDLTRANIARKMRGERNFTERDKVKLVEIFKRKIEYLLARDETPIVVKNPAPKRYSPFKNLLAELDARNMSYTALAKLLDLSQSAVSFKMLGERNFTERDKVKLVEIFKREIECLLARDDG